MIDSELPKKYQAMIETLHAMNFTIEDVARESSLPIDVIRPFFDAAQEEREAEADDLADTPAPAGEKCHGCRRRFKRSDLDAAALCKTCRQRFR
jgi:Zn finger protein HypA/HybF involved in hydrogenase expression